MRKEPDEQAKEWKAALVSQLISLKPDGPRAVLAAMALVLGGDVSVVLDVVTVTYLVLYFISPIIDRARSALSRWEALADDWATRERRRVERRTSLRSQPQFPQRAVEE